ncbi:MAG: type II toxin-antitoxin system YoeB family toxin [Peptococcaceae bacterium]|nr:type II toxin-antitoxin system YoeB family toxin [Peptococcaceae bacterium]
MFFDDIIRNGYEGIGKPEQLKGDLSGWWSSRGAHGYSTG